MTALALIPALVLLVGQPIRGSLSFGAPLAGTASLAAFVAAFLPRPRSRGPRRLPARLLSYATLRRPPQNLPDAATQASALSAALEYASDGDEAAPPGRAEAIAGALARCRAAWGTPEIAPADLPAHERLTLYLLLRLLKGDAAEAGHLAQLFQRPAAILALRDEIDRMDRIRRRYDRDTAIFEATAQLQERPAEDRPADLRAALIALGVDDIDLWHHVIADHDPHDPLQAQAALWCAAQPGCDRASIALLLARLARSGRIAQAAKTGDTAFLRNLHDIIIRWNGGVHTTAELGLDPADRLVPAAQALAEALEQVARADATPALAQPRGAFVAHTGRPPRPRPAWDIAKGGLLRAPRRADYVDPVA